MSEALVAIDAVAVLLPPAVVPPLTSLVAPVVAVTVEVPDTVGVPLTGQLMLAPAATVAGGAGEHVPTVTPAGKPETVQVAFSALAAAAPLLVHLTVPLYGVPTVAVVGRPLRSGVISEPVEPIVAVAVLLAGLPSFVAPVVPVTVVAPVVVGVPDTVQLIDAPGATLTGGVGEHDDVSPGGKPLTAQVAEVAVISGDAPFLQV